MKNTEKYYDECAYEYDNFYISRERYKDYKKIEERIQQEIENKSILELACGTGHWTNFFSKFAKMITAVDKSTNMLNIAKNKIDEDKVYFINDDVYNLSSIENNKYEVIISVFLYSHIAIQEKEKFFTSMHSKLKNNGTIILIDNLHIKGSSFPINKIDIHGNRFQKRELSNKNNYMVLKNLPMKEDFFIKNNFPIEYKELEYCWYVIYRHNKDKK